MLALPLVVGIAALQGLTVTLSMFHGSDEFSFHYPTILRFANELPFPNLANYNASQTPLFHVLMAHVGKITGYEIWRLRLVEALISYLLVLSVFRLLRTRLRMGVLQSIALALLFLLSPYVYAGSFRLLTDNLALLFSVLAIDRLERFRESGKSGPLLAAAACAGFGILTRQSSVFLFAIAGAYAMFSGSGVSVRTRAVTLGAILLALVPAVSLFLTWHGLIPPGGDKSTCGLCTARQGLSSPGLSISATQLTLAVVGLYGTVLFAPRFPWRDRTALKELLRGGAVATAACAGFLIASPAAPDSHPIGVKTTAGALWTVASHTPLVDGTPLLLWILVALAGPVLWWRFTIAPRRWLFVAWFGCFLVSTLAIRLSWQKYVDPYVLIGLLISAQPYELDRPKRLIGAAVLAVGFIAYTLSFVV
jgi:4-amino-4-deoxy-L-arabinose transferase-like glycosyltransferase